MARAVEAEASVPRGCYRPSPFLSVLRDFGHAFELGRGSTEAWSSAESRRCCLWAYEFRGKYSAKVAKLPERNLTIKTPIFLSGHYFALLFDLKYSSKEVGFLSG